ncbi:uncharacterized protein LOC131149774 [Malania oleifera]|uniref:uncharacterized protein LOC131149774 n=1 Tax=Malania oleifera TaxID=397392 RepID=UPI0025AE138F|nr:uncharacterized protein LOC131149774 [Malania oleifera]XP_057956505.1 uncharacterized protein LOC131149774 [Malania oleifera]
MPSESDKWGWKHVSVFGAFDKGSGTKRWKCNHCNLRYNGSYSRVRAHLLGFTGVGVKSCPAIDRSLREALHILEEERLAWKKKRTSGCVKPSKRNENSQLSLNHAWKTIAKEDVDDIVARFFYANGLNVDIVNSPYFHEMAKAIATFGPGYEAPTMDKLSDLFLTKEKDRIERAMVLFRESWPHTGCTIYCINQLDGTLGCLCFNIFVSSPRGLMFLKAVDISNGDAADNLLPGVLEDSIMEVGPANVLQIISHLSHVSESFESLISSKFPHIFLSACTSHSICMLMEHIAELEWIKPIVSCAKGIEQCILAYQRSPLCNFTQNFKQQSDPCAAKFAPSCCLVQSIFELKQTLREVVASEEWKQWKLSIQEDVINIESAILGDDFWGGAHLLLQLIEPFLRSFAILNVDKSVMGDICDWRVQALEAVRSKGIDDIALNQLEVLMENRWDMLFSPLHAAGYILNPRHFGKGQTKDKTVMRGWKATLERYECNGAGRRVLREQLSSYWRLEGSFGEEDAVDCRDKMDPVSWWENFGFETPHLQTLAIKILSQASNLVMCQEGWQDDIPCREIGSRLGVGRVEDLLFVRNNLRLHSQRSGNLSSASSQRSRNLSFASGQRSDNLSSASSPRITNSSSPSGGNTWDGSCLDQASGIISIQNKI